MISQDKKAILFTFLKAGLGLTEACGLADLSVKKVSSEAESDQAFKKECENQVMNGKKAYAILSNKLFSEQKFQQWKAHNEDIMTRSFKLVFWESRCAKASANNKVIIEAVVGEKNIGDAATSIGYTIEELTSEIIKSPILRRGIEVIKK